MDNIQLDIHAEECTNKIGWFLLKNSEGSNMSQLAKEIGITTQMVSKICNGQVVSFKIFLKILNWAQIEFDSILELKDKK